MIYELNHLSLGYGYVLDTDCIGMKWVGEENGTLLLMIDLVAHDIKDP